MPTANIGSSAGYFVMLGGLLFHSPNLVYFGALLFSAVLLFQVVTLPVEFDATARAKRLAVETGIVLPQEREGMDKVLNAAAMTYVAAVVSTLMTLLYYLLRASSMSRRSEPDLRAKTTPRPVPRRGVSVCGERHLVAI